MNFWQYLPLTPQFPLPRDCVAGRGDFPGHTPLPAAREKGAGDEGYRAKR